MNNEVPTLNNLVSISLLFLRIYFISSAEVRFTPLTSWTD